jgi:hypothetical protein
MNTTITSTYPSVDQADVFKDKKAPHKAPPAVTFPEDGPDRQLTHRDLVKVLTLLTDIQEIAGRVVEEDSSLDRAGLIGSIRAKAMIAEVYLQTTIPL